MERGADRRGAWRRAAAVAAEINAPEPPHLLGAEHIARAAISAVGRTIAAIVEGAVIEQQRLDRIALAGIAQLDRRRQGQLPPGRIAADSDPVETAPPARAGPAQPPPPHHRLLHPPRRRPTVPTESEH